MSTPNSEKEATLALNIKDKAALYAAFMPFIKGGALFIATSQEFKLSDEISVVIQFMEETEKIQFIGRVIWITPRGAQGGRAAGVGVQIVEDKTGKLMKKIETILAGSEKAERATHTL
ncbi:MAG: PilZ domain-containing protein [Legionellales bacterium]|nr:PilZ domain-containing protein [Legionellales bacterium]